MPNPERIKMEDMSEAYLRALCAANGFTVERVARDNDGVDVRIECNDKIEDDSDLHSVLISVQLKSSYAKITEHPDGSITYKLEVKNYNQLVDEKRMNPIILVVFHMPSDEAQWIELSKDWLKIKKCAYWISLRGRPRSDNSESISITIPAGKLLTKETLRDIVVRVSKKQEL